MAAGPGAGEGLGPASATEFVESFGSLVRRRRKVLAITQSDLATRLGVSQDSVKRWERGEVPRHVRTRRVALASADVLGVTSEAVQRALDESVRAVWYPYCTFQVGTVIGKLTVKSLGHRLGGDRAVECTCVCGVVKLIRVSGLSGRVRSCGCAPDRMTNTPRKMLPIGARFGRLVIQREVDRKTRWRRRVECLCDCGQLMQADFTPVQSGNTKSCGCLQRESVGLQIRYRRPFSTPLRPHQLVPPADSR